MGKNIKSGGLKLEKSKYIFYNLNQIDRVRIFLAASHDLISASNAIAKLKNNDSEAFFPVISSIKYSKSDNKEYLYNFNETPMINWISKTPMNSIPRGFEFDFELFNGKNSLDDIVGS